MVREKKTIRIMLMSDQEAELWRLHKLIEGKFPRITIVGTAKSGDAALAQSEELLPDVIVLALGQGEQHALDLLPRLLPHSASRVLILTDDENGAILDLAVLQGARGLLSKDASAEHIFKAIEKIHDGELWMDRGTLGRIFGELIRVRRDHDFDSTSQRKASLTCWERKVVDTLVEESRASPQAIAHQLAISAHALRNCLTSIYQKLGVNNRLELYIYAIKHQLREGVTEGVARELVVDNN